MKKKLAITTRNMKNYFKNMNTKHLLIGVLGFATLIVITFIFYALSVIGSIKPIMAEVDQLSSLNDDQNLNSEVEAEAVTETLSLNRFLSFSQSHKEKLRFLKDFSSSFAKSSTELTFEHSGYIPRVLKNDCDRFRCLQNKVEFEAIAPPLWKGLLGIEDYRFLDHSGVDPVSIARAIIIDIKSMRLVQGGSTLTQQLVKNLFLSNEKTFGRKIKEMIFALYIEHFYKKEQIITAYFNEVFWGTLQGVYLKGVDAAARAYFDKPSNEVSEYEASILISLLKGPYFYHPLKHSDRLKERVKTVFERLKQLGLVSKKNEGWSEEDWSQWIHSLSVKDNETYLRSVTFLKSEDHAINDYEKFILIEGIYKFLDGFKKKFPGKDIAVKAYMSPINCEIGSCDKEFKFYSKIERDLEVAIKEERHQIGSILKPLIYKIFLQEGKQLDDLVSTEKIKLKLKSGTWIPRDSNILKDQNITLLQALQLSKNRPLIRIAQEVGFDKVEKHLMEYLPNIRSPLKEFPAQLLGAVELSLEEIANIYRRFTLDTCREVKDGQKDFENTIFYHMAQAEKTTIRNFVDKRVAGTLIFGKTGTTNNGNDNWYVASDGNLVTVIWTGIETRENNEKTPLSGASSSFKIYQNFVINRGKRLSEIYCM